MKLIQILSIFGAILTAVIIFLLSSISHDPAPQIEIPFKSIAYHFIIFFILALFLAMSFKSPQKYTLLAMSFLAIGYAVTDEFHQLFVPGRVASITDWLIDSIGVVIANIVYFIRTRN